MSGRRTQEQDEQPVEAQQADEQPKRLDETIPGGKYKTADGRLVNANGDEIDANGKVKKQD